MKKYQLPLLLILTLVVCMLGCSEDMEGADEETTHSLYVFGDSWSDAMDDGVIQDELADRGFDESVAVKPFAIGGTTMAQWADDEEGVLSHMLAEIVNDPTASPIVFFTLSGNDILQGGSVDQVLADQRRLLTQLEASRDDLQIVFAAYDLFNPNISPEECTGLMTSVFGSAEPAVVNQVMTDAYAQSATVVAEFERVTTANTYGSLQGSPGSPDLNAWSPVEYLADCIHLNDEGYGLYLDTVFDGAITPLLCEDAGLEAPACPDSAEVISYLPTIINGR